jgi:Sigma-54 interaction domain
MPLSGLHGESPQIVAIRAQVAQLLAHQPRSPAPCPDPRRDSTGKGLLARSIHQAGPRRDGPFVGVNCAAIPETLLEAELFGYERGAFTDARHAKPGLFQTAQGGTLFLDEIGLLPAALQAKLLTVLEDRAVRRLGSTRPGTRRPGPRRRHERRARAGRLGRPLPRRSLPSPCRHQPRATAAARPGCRHPRPGRPLPGPRVRRLRTVIASTDPRGARDARRLSVARQRAGARQCHGARGAALGRGGDHGRFARFPQGRRTTR